MSGNWQLTRRNENRFLPGGWIGGTPRTLCSAASCSDLVTVNSSASISSIWWRSKSEGISLGMRSYMISDTAGYHQQFICRSSSSPFLLLRHVNYFSTVILPEFAGLFLIIKNILWTVHWQSIHKQTKSSKQNQWSNDEQFTNSSRKLFCRYRFLKFRNTNLNIEWQ